MLDFARELFLRLAPNTTGWCDTLESFLNTRKYKLQTKVRRMLALVHLFSLIVRSG